MADRNPDHPANLLEHGIGGWRYLTINSVTLLRSELTEGKYLWLTEEEVPLKVFIGDSLVVYPGGPSAYALRRLTHVFKDSVEGPVSSEKRYTPWMRKQKQ